MTEPIDQNKIVEIKNVEYSKNEVIKEPAAVNDLPKEENRADSGRQPAIFRSEEDPDVKI